MTLTLLTCLSLLSAQAQEASPEAAEGVVQAWGLTYGAYAGGTTGYLVGEALEASESAHVAQGVVPGALVGGLVGVSTATLLARGREVDLDRGVHLWSASSLGTFYGVQVGRALIGIDADGAVERVHAAGLAGSMAGAGLGFMAPAPDYRQSLHLDLATGIGAVAGSGLSDAAGLELPTHRQGRAGINLASAAGFGGIATLHGALGAEQPNAASWGLALGQGAWIGGWSPYLFSDSPSDRQVLGGARAGLGVGYAGALLLAAAGNVDGRSAALQGVGIAAGSALGAGIPLAIGEEPTTRQVVAPMLAGGVAGQALGAAVAPHYELSDNDAFLLGSLGAWTGYQAAGWAAYASATEQPSSQAVGYALSAGGAGTLMAMGLAPVLDVPASGSAMMLAGGGWGTWYGGWTAQILDTGPDTGWLMLLSAGDAALLGTAVAQGAGWTPSWRDVGLVNGMGLLGSAGGGLIGVVALYDEDDWDPMVGAVLGGTTIGLGTGIVLAARSGQSDLASYDLPEVRLGRGQWQPRVAAQPWMSDDGDPGVYAELSLTETGLGR